MKLLMLSIIHTIVQHPCLFCFVKTNSYFVTLFTVVRAFDDNCGTLWLYYYQLSLISNLISESLFHY